MAIARICARYLRKASANFGIRRGFVTHAGALFLGSIAHGEEKGGRQAGGGGREKGSGNEKKKGKEGKKERPISSAVEFHERTIAADVRSAEELCGREIPQE